MVCKFIESVCLGGAYFLTMLIEKVGKSQLKLIVVDHIFSPPTPLSFQEYLFSEYKTTTWFSIKL